MEQALSVLNWLKRRPFAVLALCFAGGAAFAGLMAAGRLWMAVSAAGFAVLATGCLLISGLRRFAAAAIALLFFALGGLRYSADAEVGGADISLRGSGPVTVYGVVDSDATESASAKAYGKNAIKLRAEVLRAGVGRSIESLSPAVGKLQVSLTLPPETENGVLPAPGDLILMHGTLHLPREQTNPEGLDQAARLATQQVHALLQVSSAEDWSFTPAPGSPLLRAGQRLRTAMLHHFEAVLSPELAQIAGGILFGGRAAMGGRLRAEFAEAGLAHLLATAGLHIGALIAFILWAGRRTGIKPNAAIVSALIAGWIYTFACGAHGGSVRAMLMATVVLCGRLLQREPDSASAIGVAALVLLIREPLGIFDPGFQLSFATVITIAVMMPLWQRLIKAVRSGMRGRNRLVQTARWAAGYGMGSVGIMISAQLGSFPLAANYFHIAAPLGPIAGLFLMPFVAPLIIVGLAAGLLGSIHPILSLPFDLILKLLCLLVKQVLGSAGQIGIISAPSPGPVLLITYYTTLWLGALLTKHQLDEREPETTG